MSVKLVMLKSGEDIIADVKELKTEEGIVVSSTRNMMKLRTLKYMAMTDMFINIFQKSIQKII